MTPATIHASAVLTGARAVLIRGASGAGKSRLAFDLIEAGRTGALRFARLVGDDRVHVRAAGGRLLIRPAEALAGLLEVRGLGILRLPYEPSAVAGLVVDLGADAERLPGAGERRAEIQRISLPRLAVADGKGALRAVLAVLTSSAAAFGMPDLATL
jgi:HPr kinase/phosphorylase